MSTTPAEITSPEKANAAAVRPAKRPAANGTAKRAGLRVAAHMDPQELKAYLQSRLLDRLNPQEFALLPDDRARTSIEELISDLLDEVGIHLDGTARGRLIDEVRDEVFGLGPLEPLLQDGGISDILVNSAGAVYVEKAGQLELTPVRFRDNAHLLRVIEKIVSRVGRRIDEKSPLVDARLSDGSRVNAAVPPIAIDGPALCIRRFGRNALQPEQLVKNYTLTDPMLQFLQGCIKARLNIIISGGTGSGKTTLLNALSSYIPMAERIVTIEDAAELRLQQPHVVRLETRPPSIDGQDPVSIRHLVVNALRMRPDRIIVGEVRAEEALDMMQAMNTGHDGSLTTIHANSPRDALARLEVMITMANSNLGVRAIRQQVSSAIHLVVQIVRFSDGARRVINITEVSGMEGEIITMQDIFLFEKSGVTADAKISGKFRASGIRPKVFDKLKTAGIELPVNLLQTQVQVN